MKILKYLTIAGLVTTGLSIILDLVGGGFNESTYWKFLTCSWMASNLVSYSRIEDLESYNKTLSDHIQDLLSRFNKFRTHHNI